MADVPLVRDAKTGAAGHLSRGGMRPPGTERAFGANGTVVRAGDPAHEMHDTESSVVRVPEVGIVGEPGLLAPGDARTASPVCEVPGKAPCVTSSDLETPYNQNSDFGFHVLKLTAERPVQSAEAADRPVATADALRERRTRCAGTWPRQSMLGRIRSGGRWPSMKVLMLMMTFSPMSVRLS